MRFQDDRWLCSGDHGYSLGNHSVPYEDAIIMLVEHALGFPAGPGELEKFKSLLERRMPNEDWEAVAKQINMESRQRERARDEKWIIEKLQLTESPGPYWNADWEELHRIAVAELDPDWSGIINIFFLNETFNYGELWHFVQRYRPAKCPLRQWEVCLDARVWQEREDGRTPDVKTSRVLAFSQETARAIYEDYECEVIWVKEIEPSNPGSYSRDPR
ncbi:hypothetical protein [Tunturiibacter gelidoferens]|uniref:Uncharacterized protein n=1 Tax=Tunturiibacter gelidiferens TaxID=3069689 RepID=A0A9X0QFK3_9BACT|nr:hypothetical protein [Edaphobacter lichenicola]MBB5329450.1 hypothetical protein [Edaphobacter lichenicola]